MYISHSKNYTAFIFLLFILFISKLFIVLDFYWLLFILFISKLYNVLDFLELLFSRIIF